MKYSMYSEVWQWLIEAAENIYEEITSCYNDNDEHDVACVCSNCVYLQLTILLEEYLESSNHHINSTTTKSLETIESRLSFSATMPSN